jgi:hypothetical protein
LIPRLKAISTKIFPPATTHVAPSHHEQENFAVTYLLILLLAFAFAFSSLVPHLPCSHHTPSTHAAFTPRARKLHSYSLFYILAFAFEPDAIWSWGAGDATASDDDNDPMPFQALPSAVEDQREEDTPPDPPAMTQSLTHTTPTLAIRKTKNPSMQSPFKFTGSSFTSRKKHHFEFEDEGPVTPRTFLSRIMTSPVIKARNTLTKTQKKKKEGNIRRSQRQLSIRASIRFLDFRSLSSNDINDSADPVVKNEKSISTISTSNTNAENCWRTYMQPRSTI